MWSSYYLGALPGNGVHGLRITKLPNRRKIKIVGMVRVGDQGILMLGSRGTLYGSVVHPGCMRVSTNDLQVFEAAVKLGVLSQDDFDEVSAWTHAEKETSRKSYDAGYFLEYAEKLGIKLTKAQNEKVQAML